MGARVVQATQGKVKRVLSLQVLEKTGDIAGHRQTENVGKDTL